MTSCRIDTSDYFANSCVIGNTGLGVAAETVPAVGDAGPAPLYDDFTFPADNGKEVRFELLTIPSSGTFWMDEDSSCYLVGAADGHYTATGRVWVDGIALSGTETVDFYVGSVGANAPGATLTGTGTLSAGSASGGAAGVAPGASLTGTGSLSAGSASGGTPGVAPGATLTGTGSLSAGSATGNQSATAPGVTLTGTGHLAPGHAAGNTPTQEPDPRWTVCVRARLMRVRFQVLQHAHELTEREMINERFPDKHHEERHMLTFDFSLGLEVGESVNNIESIELLVLSGQDPSPTDLLDGSASISGAAKILQPIKGGLASVDYEFRVTAATSNPNKTLTCIGKLYVI